MSIERLAAAPGGCPLPAPWEVERQAPKFDGDEIVLDADGAGLLLPLPAETHPRVKMSFELLGEEAFAFMALVGWEEFSFGGMQAPNNSITRQSVSIAEKKGPVGETGRWHRFEIEVGGGRARMTLDGDVFLDGEDPSGPRTFNAVGTKHWGRQRMRNLVVEYETPAPVAKRPERFDLQMVVDFYDDIYHAEPFDRAAFEGLFDTLKGWGVSRTYWHYFLAANHFDDRTGLFAQTAENVGDFLKLVIALAHERKMELFVTLKPFDILWSGRTDIQPRPWILDRPHCPPPSLEETGRLGGERVNLPGWLEAHEEALVQRCPVAMPDGDVAEIVIAKEDDRPAGFDANAIRLFVSNDNRTYVPYAGSVQTSEQVETRPKRRHTVRGPVEESETETVTVIRLSGLAIGEPYFAVVAPDEPAALAFCNSYYKLVEARTAGGEFVPTTLGLHAGAKFERAADFRERGAAFDWGDTSTQGIWGQPDYVERRGSLRGNNGFLALARGKNRHLDMLSAAHPLSHKLWLEIVRRCIELGADGMDFRIRCHKSTLEWSAFGFEPGVRDAFRERYGVDIREGTFDREAWRRLRGEFYTDFVRAASGLLHAAGRKMQHHVSPGMTPPPSQPTILNTHFDWDGWLREGLLDSITCKQLEHSSEFFERVRDAAHAHGAKIFDCPYINTYFHGAESAWATRLRKNVRLARASGLDGYMIYENAAVLRCVGGAVEETREGIGELLRSETRA